MDIKIKRPKKPYYSYFNQKMPHDVFERYIVNDTFKPLHEADYTNMIYLMNIWKQTVAIPCQITDNLYYYSTIDTPGFIIIPHNNMNYIIHRFSGIMIAFNGDIFTTSTKILYNNKEIFGTGNVSATESFFKLLNSAISLDYDDSHNPYNQYFNELQQIHLDKLYAPEIYSILSYILSDPMLIEFFNNHNGQDYTIFVDDFFIEPINSKNNMWRFYHLTSGIIIYLSIEIHSDEVDVTYTQSSHNNMRIYDYQVFFSYFRKLLGKENHDNILCVKNTL